MRLDQAIVIRGLCETRTEAQELIASGGVLLNNKPCLKQTTQIEHSDHIVVTQRRKFVSRGGSKLEGALLEVYKTEHATRDALDQKNALDVGSSTGGFTDCLLTYGVMSVTAVDVGTSQLHSSLHNNPKIQIFENTDIRNFNTDTRFDIIVADLSFIPLEKVFDILVSFGTSLAEYFLLIKPQFEVGKGGTKKGIVKNQLLVDEIIIKYKDMCEKQGFTVVTIFPCIISGGDGNQEYFLYAKKGV